MTQIMVEESELTDEAIKVMGEVVTELPQDLYIPPGALKIFLEAFEGPLDLLLYLIKKQHIDILNIPIVDITRQYVEYVELMQEMQIELAAEYLVMAAMLAEIKSRLLLPRPAEDEEAEGQDPRAELIRRLQEYERFKQAAQQLEERPRVERDFFIGQATKPVLEVSAPPPEVTLDELMGAFKEVMKRANLYNHHQVAHEVLTVRERMSLLLDSVSSDSFTEFTQLFNVKEGRVGVVVSLIAILELVRQKVLEIVQTEALGPIYVKATAGSSD